MSKPTVPEVLPLVRAFCKVNGAGCCLHIVLDDGNVRDHFVAYCFEVAQERGHESCAMLARILYEMSRTQRSKLRGMRFG